MRETTCKCSRILIDTMTLVCQEHRWNFILFSREIFLIKIFLGVSNIAGRRSILKLAQRMTSSFCEAIGSSKCRSWTKASTKNHEEIFYTSRKNNNEPGEPLGLILCSVSSTWLPISPTTLYNFLREDSRRDDVSF